VILRHVAVKLFAESQAHTRLRAEFFGRECRALQELRHPSIIELFDWGVDETTGERFLVLDWMEDTLESRRGDSFEGWDSFYDEIGRAILEALSFAHGRWVWHRDLKPANVLLDVAGRPKLADFSIAKVDRRWDPTRTVGAFGSPPFTPPENDDGTASGGRDCWSYAAIVLYCLTQIQGGVALRFARVKRYRPDKDAGEADTIDDLRALLPARAGDEFHASGSSKEVLNRKDEHPEEER